MSQNHNQVVLAVHLQGESLGLSHVDTLRKCLTVLEDVKVVNFSGAAESEAVQLVRSLVEELNVTKVLVSTRLSMDVTAELDKDVEHNKFELLHRPSHEFTIENARRLTHHVLGNGIAQNHLPMTRPEYEMKVSNQMVDDGEVPLFVDCFFSGDGAVIGAMGALMTYIQREHDLDSLVSIERESLAGTMLISNSTLSALHVFDSDPKGISLFSLLDCTRTRSGSKLLESWVRRPSTNPEVIESRHQAIEELMASDRFRIQQTLRKTKDMFAVLGNMSSGRTSLTDWENLVNFLSSMKELGIRLPECGLRNALETTEILDSINNLHELVTHVVDFELSESEKRVVVQPQADPDLDEMKAMFDNIETVLKTKAQQMDIPDEERGGFSIIYFPQLGYLLSMMGDYKQDDWALSFQTPECCYYKSQDVIEMDDELGDLFGMICDREIELMRLVEQQVLSHSELLQNLARLTAEVDCCCALAQAAESYGYVKPDITQDGDFDVTEGRHPLHELGVTFIPNDTVMDSNHPIMVMTGANFSGKSVYLTQVALIVLMAQIGSFVPASEAKISIVDKILVRISTEESLAKQHSAFMIDLQQMSVVLRSMTGKSLVVIDEFGQGTNCTDGAALFGSTIRYMQSLDSTPKVLASTHYHQLFDLNVLNVSKMIVNHMEVQFIQENELTYLYAMKPGKSSSSFGVCCAAMCGVPKPIVARADYIVNQLTITGSLSSLIQPSEQEKQEIEQAGALAREFLKLDTTNISHVQDFITTIRLN